MTFTLCAAFLCLFYSMGVFLLMKGNNVRVVEMESCRTSTNFWEQSGHLLMASRLVLGIAAIWTLFWFCIWEYIALAVAVTKTVALFIAKKPPILVVPIIYSLYLILYLAWFLIILI